MADAFSETEQAAMLERDGLGKVFLPDSRELEDPAMGFSKQKSQNKLRKAWATEYAIRVTGAYVYQPKNGNHTPYWLREQSTTDKRQGRSIKSTGAIGRLGVSESLCVQHSLFGPDPSPHFAFELGQFPLDPVHQLNGLGDASSGCCKFSLAEPSLERFHPFPGGYGSADPLYFGCALVAHIE